MKRKQSAAQLANLKVPSPREARENGKKGGKRSQEVQKKYRSLKELAKEALDEDTVKQIYASLIAAAKDGDVRAWESIRDTAGEKPTERIEAEAGITFGFDESVDPSWLV